MADQTRRNARAHVIGFTPMVFAFVLFLVAMAFWIDLLWLPAIFCAVAVMHWTAGRHPADPLAPLYAFLISAMAARLALDVLRRLVVRAAR